MRNITTTVYLFNELSDTAKEKARQWWREASAGDNSFSEFVIDDASIIAEMLGITFKARDVKLYGGGTRSGPCVYWSGFSSQGDGACFEGTWRVSDLKAGKVAEHAPQDKELHRIAAEFERIATHYPAASFTVKHRGRYQHKGCTEFDVNIEDGDQTITDEAWNAAHDSLVEVTRDFMEWIYRQLEQAHDYENSDDQIDESIIANEYEFTIEGKRI